MNIAELFFNYGYYKYFNEKRFLRKKFSLSAVLQIESGLFYIKNPEI